MATEKVVKTKFKILFEDKGGSYTYSNIKETATIDDIYTTAIGFSKLLAKPADSFYRVVDYTLEP